MIPCKKSIVNKKDTLQCLFCISLKLNMEGIFAIKF